MKTKSSFFQKWTFYLIIVIFGSGPFAGFSQWQATMVDSKPGGPQEYIVHSNMEQYRYDFTMDGQKGVVIVNPQKKVTAVIMPEKKMVHYAEIDGWMSRSNDPVQAYESYKSMGEEKIEGSEEMQGYDCTKKVIYQGDEKVFSQWFSEELNFPVRIESHYAENQYMQLKNIRDWNVDPTLFGVPDDYTKVDEEMRPVIPEPPPPDNWTEQELEVPLETDAGRGDLISVPIRETVYHKLVVENIGDTPAKFRYTIFKDGKELPEDEQGPEKRRTARLYMGEDYKMTFDWKEGWVVVFRIFEGQVKLEVEPDK